MNFIICSVQFFHKIVCIGVSLSQIKISCHQCRIWVLNPFFCPQISSHLTVVIRWLYTYKIKYWFFSLLLLSWTKYLSTTSSFNPPKSLMWNFSEIWGIEMEVIENCNSNNGGCEHICTNALHGKKCSCFVGYILERNGVSCAGRYWHFL